MRKPPLESLLMTSKTLFIVAALLASTVLSGRSNAQAIGEAPRSEYYIARDLFETGRLADAAEGFRLTISRSLRIREKPWIDSIPPLVMLGESYFHVGKVALAMEQYDAALTIAIEYSNWIEQVAAPDLQPFDSKAKGINWFSPSRPTQLTATPEPGLLTVDVAGQPGAGQPMALSTRVDSSEVLRTTAIALARRGEVLGPLAKYSPLAVPLNQLLGRDIAQRAEWARASWRLLRGIHAMSVPSEVDPVALITANAILTNDVDYFMTPFALLQLGNYQRKQKGIQSALPYWQDASLSAARHSQYAVLAETLQTLSAACAATNRTDLLNNIQNAASWGAKQSAFVQANGFAGAAELATMSGDWTAAESNSKQAAAALRMRDVMLPRAQAQLFFANAITAFGENRGVLGKQSLESALKIMRGTAQDGAMAKQIFQMQMVLNLLQANALQVVDAEAVFAEILDEPGIGPWQVEPLETIAAMTTSAVPAYGTALEFAERRGTKEQVVERMDRIHRQRFFEALPMGGRLFSLRAALLGDPQRIPAEMQPIVAQLQQDAPELAKSTQRIAQLRAALSVAPLPIEDRQVTAEMRKSLTELGKAAELQENLLHLHALKRRPFNRFAPFSATVAKIQAALDENDLTLGFVCTNGRMYGAAITKNTLETWSSAELPQIEEQIKTLLTEIGLSTPSKVTPTAATAMNATWRETAAKLYGKLLPANIQAMVAGADKILVVPDGVLWYLPFEMLPTSSRSSHSPWLAKHAVTYFPTLGSIPLASAPAPKIERSLYATSNFFGSEKAFNESLTEKIGTEAPGLSRIELGSKNHSPFAHWSRLMTEQLIVTSKLEASARPFETNLLPLDGSQTALLGSWIESPCRTPSRVILPGYQTTASSSKVADGLELMIPACSLLYNGTNSALLSRWPVGGRSTQVLLCRFLQELDRESPSVAWQRSAAAFWADEFLIADEPALLPSGKETAALVSGQHPKLWSGYMVIGDSQLPTPNVP